MATVNKRVYNPVAATANGVACGGVMTVALEEGYETVIRSSPDGLAGPAVVDREAQYVRGSLVFQGWLNAIPLLLGTIGTFVFYERKSGAAAATGYTKHTLTNPMIYSISLNVTKGGYATVSARFECKAESETANIGDMHAMLDSQAAPTHVPAARGGFRISAGVHGSLDIYHITNFSFAAEMPIRKACNDADLAYTAVDVCNEAITVSGSLGFQDSEITSAELKAQQLLLASAGDLVLTIVQSGGAETKTVTIANAFFVSGSQSSDVNSDYSEYSLNYEVGNDPDTPLTLDGTNKVLTIA
ncbi:MAG: hypothetical protein WCZ89_02295 [Phycisphaerae bacterium]